MRKILIVEDSQDTQVILNQVLKPHFEVQIASTIGMAKKLMDAQTFSLILLDRMLPDGDGLDFCSQIRAQFSATPLIMLTAKSEVEDKVSGLNAGADDYVAKPIVAQELLARIESVLRRGPIRNSENVVTIADIHVDVQKQQAWLGNNSEKALIDLTPIEFRLLLSLANHFENSMSREDLIQSVWDSSVHLNDRNVDAHICNLRRKIGPSQVTVRNQRKKGYALVYSLNNQQVEKPVIYSADSLPGVKNTHAS